MWGTVTSFRPHAGPAIPISSGSTMFAALGNSRTQIAHRRIPVLRIKKNGRCLPVSTARFLLHSTCRDSDTPQIKSTTFIAAFTGEIWRERGSILLHKHLE